MTHLPNLATSIIGLYVVLCGYSYSASFFFFFLSGRLQWVIVKVTTVKIDRVMISVLEEKKTIAI